MIDFLECDLYQIFNEKKYRLEQYFLSEKQALISLLKGIGGKKV